MGKLFSAKGDMLKEAWVSICALKEKFQKGPGIGHPHGRRDASLQVYVKVSLLLAAILEVFALAFIIFLN